MKRLQMIMLTLVLALTMSAQTTVGNGSDFRSLNNKESYRNFTMWQLGYSGDAAANGAYLGYLFGIRVWQGLYVNTGLRAGWRMASIPYFDDVHFIEIKVPVRVGYQVNLTKDVSIIPQTGMNLGGIAGVSSGTEGGFAMGWDFGAILRFKQRYFLTYEYTVGITGQGAEHNAGIGIDF